MQLWDISDPQRITELLSLRGPTVGTAAVLPAPTTLDKSGCGGTSDKFAAVSQLWDNTNSKRAVTELIIVAIFAAFDLSFCSLDRWFCSAATRSHQVSRS